MAREDGNWIQDWDSGANLKVNADGSLNTNTSFATETLDGKTFSLTTEITPGTANETASLLIKNPSANTKNIYLNQLVVSALLPDFGTVVRMYASPTVTANGSAVSARNLLIKSGSPASTGEFYSFPTTTSFGNLLSTGVVLKAITAEFIRDFSYSRIVAPGNSVLVTIENTANGRTAAITLSWKEEDVA